MQGKLHLDSMYSIMSIFSEKYRLLICFKNYFVRKNSINITVKNVIKECHQFQMYPDNCKFCVIKECHQFQIYPDNCKFCVSTMFL